MTCRQRLAAWLAPVAAVLTYPATALATFRGSDVWSQTFPDSGSNGLMDKYPLSRYQLDVHADTASVNVTGAHNTDTLPEQIAQLFAKLLWLATTWLAKITITIFHWATSVDLLNAIFHWATSVDLLNGPHGALAPVTTATTALYNNLEAMSLVTCAVIALGVWATVKGVAQRRYSDVTTGIAVTVVLMAGAVVLITKPIQTIGEASKDTNQISAALLTAGTQAAAPGSNDPQTTVEDHLWTTLVVAPWSVLNFGAVSHCTMVAADTAGFPRPVDSSAVPSAASMAAGYKPGTSVCRDHLKAHNGYGGYVPRYLAYPPGSPERQAFYDAINNGETPNDPCKDAKSKTVGNPTTGVVTTVTDQCDKNMFAGWNVDRADAPAVDIQQTDGALGRFGMALLIFAGVLGACLLLGLMAFGCLIAQVVALGFFAFTPVILLAALIPGLGHRFFMGWGKRLALAVFVKILFSVGLAVLLGVSLALTTATGALSWGMAFGLQAALFWAVWILRKKIWAHVPGATAAVSAGGKMSAPARVAMGVTTTGVGTVAGMAVEKHREHRKDLAMGGTQPGTMDDSAKSTVPRPPSSSPNGNGSAREWAKPTADFSDLDGPSGGTRSPRAPRPPSNGNGNGAKVVTDRSQAMSDPKPRTSGPVPDTRPEEHPPPPPPPVPSLVQGPPPDTRPEERNGHKPPSTNGHRP